MRGNHRAAPIAACRSRHDLHEPACRIQSVVESRNNGPRKHVARHFAGELRVLLFHLGFDHECRFDTLIGRPPNRASSSYKICEHFTSPTERCAPVLRVRISRPKDQQQHVAVITSPFSSTAPMRSESLVERDAQVGLMRLHRVHQMPQILRNSPDRDDDLETARPYRRTVPVTFAVQAFESGASAAPPCRCRVRHHSNAPLEIETAFVTAST